MNFTDALLRSRLTLILQLL